MHVVQVKTSCPCVTVSPLPTRVLPHESFGLTVTFNTAKEPDFRGNLSVGVTDLGDEERIVFRTRVKLTVTR